MRSSFIVGFPGETEDDVDDLESFLSAASLDWVGLFPYSAEAGTVAAELERQVPKDVALERLRHLQSIQDDITHAKNAAQVGEIVEVLVDQVEDGQSVGRSYRQAPEIDGVVLLDAGTPGEWLSAEMVGAYGTDLEAKVLR
jgi:ribosomal protein S12 methylthiotransferase